NELMFKIALEEAPDPAAVVPGLDPGFAAIVRKAMARDPAQRFQTATDFQDAILDWMKQNGLSTSFVSKNYSSSRLGSAATEPPGAGSPLSTSTNGTSANGMTNPAAAKVPSFGGSLPNVASSVGGIQAPTKSKAPIAIGAAVLLVAAAAGVFLSVGSKKGVADSANAASRPATPVVTADPAVAPAVTTAPTVVAAPAPSAPVVDDKGTPTAGADAGNSPKAVPVVHATPRTPTHAPVHAAAAPAAPSATASAKANVRGRTIREQL
ncbi:MAG: hypothetical protein U0169_13145, partial [Polyangiaceae bacterium]